MAILVASPDLVRVSCKTPRQMLLANPYAELGNQVNEFTTIVWARRSCFEQG